MDDRPVMQIFAPKPAQAKANALREPPSAAAKWSDIETIYASARAYLDNTYMLAEAARVINPDWSVGNACFFGCKPTFSMESVWVEPLGTDEDEYPPIEFDGSSPWYKFMLDFTAYCAARNDRDFYLTPHFGNSAADTLSLIRSDAALMIDIYENPAWIKQSMQTIGKALHHIFHTASGIIGAANGFASWFGCVADKPVVIADADISCLISPKQFETLFLEQIIEQISWAPYSQYHLDGPDALRHLDLLLAIPALNAIQWVPGSGHDEILQWVPIIKKIQTMKKSVQVYVRPCEVLPLLDEVSGEGLCMTTHCGSADEADQLLAAVQKRM